LGFDLGNEVGVLQKIDTLNNSVSPDEADNWAAAMLSHCEDVCPGKFHVNGVDHTHWFYISQYATTLLENAAACQNLWGFTWWCSHDIDPAMKGFLSLEYTLGVFDQQNRVKPLGKALSALAEQWRKNPPAALSRSTALVIPDNGLSKRATWPIGASRNNTWTW
jgi:hypothetical protein